ncbi:MAG: PAS domain S-box-containing protein [Planctomycetota bacterium]|jgi:PAS domain S-box-containing protein
MHSPMPRALVLGITHENKLHCASDTAPSFLGCQADAAIGQDLDGLFCEPGITAEILLASDVPLILNLKRGQSQPLEVLASATRMHLEGDERVTLVMINDSTQALRERVQLESSEARLQAVLASMLDAVITIDDHGLILGASESVTRLFGYQPAELLGNNISMLMPEPHRSAHDSYLQKYRTDKLTWILGTTREFVVIGRNGQSILVELSVNKVNLPDSIPSTFVGSFRDITARKRAERALIASERRFRRVFDQEFQLVILLRSDGVMLEVNRTLLQLTNLATEDLLGTLITEAPFWDSITANGFELDSALTRARAGRDARTTVHLRDADGVRRPLELVIKLIHSESDSHANNNEQVELLLVEARDMTELNTARRREQEVQTALAALGERAAVMAHEIKTPVTAVHMALRAVSRQLGQDEQEVLEDLVLRMRKLEDLLHGTLDFSRPISVSPRRVSAIRLVESTLAMVGEWIAERDMQIEISLPDDLPPLLVDPERTSQALSNLVRNACEACTAGGHVRISGEAMHGDRIVLWVDDDGPGVAPDTVEEMFKPFQTSRLDGNGIGLPLARRVAEAHGGHLDYAVSPLGGARFQLILPSAIEVKQS